MFWLYFYISQKETINCRQSTKLTLTLACFTKQKLIASIVRSNYIIRSITNQITLVGLAVNMGSRWVMMMPMSARDWKHGRCGIPVLDWLLKIWIFSFRWLPWGRLAWCANTTRHQIAPKIAYICVIIVRISIGSSSASCEKRRGRSTGKIASRVETDRTVDLVVTCDTWLLK